MNNTPSFAACIRRSLLVVCLLLSASVQASLLDYFSSPTGVYKFESKDPIGVSHLETLDLRGDKTFVWESRMVLPLDAQGLMIRPDSVSTVRGNWRSSFGKTTLTWTVTAGGNSNTVKYEFTLDDGDLIEQIGDKRRFSKSKS